MAEIRSIYTDKRKNDSRGRTGYVEGAAVRKLQSSAAPAREDRRARQEKRQRAQQRRVGQRQAQGLGLGYVVFLAAACALTMWVCVGYLQLQADNTATMKSIAALETQLSDLKEDNDDEYNRVVTSVDLEKIRDIAINELGMVYAQEDQVVLYDSEGSDYVRQYADIPEEESGLKDLLGTISR